jgi:epoxide hydrolase 4
VLCIPLFLKRVIFYILIMPVLAVMWVIAILSRVSIFSFFKHMKIFGNADRDINRPQLSDKVKNSIFNKQNGTEVYIPGIHAIEKGPKSGPLMIFIHGFPDSHLSWRYQMNHFSNTYRCVAISLPGYGQSLRQKKVEAYQIASIVLQVVATIKHLNSKGKAIIVGHDWGGVIAYGVATLHPEVVDKLIVMSSPHPQLYFDNLTWKQFFMSFYFILFQMPYFPEFFFSLNKYDILLKAAASLSEEDAIIMQWCFSHPETVTPAINYYRNLFTMEYSTFNAFLTRRLDMPLLVLWGGQDEFLVPSLNKGLRERVACRGELFVIKEAHHFLQQEVPGEVNSRMEGFLNVYS